MLMRIQDPRFYSLSNFQCRIVRMRLAILLLWFGLFSMSVQSEVNPNIQYRFTNMSIKDGLPDSRIVEIYQQNNGLVWFATPTGAASFDGVRFTTYSTRSTPAIIGNKVTNFSEDERGDIWISTTEGVTRLRSGIESQHYSMANKQAYWSSQVFHDSLGSVWSANNEGLAKLNGNNEFEYVAFHEGEQRAYVTSIVEYQQHLYISTTEGIFKLAHQQENAKPEHIIKPSVEYGSFKNQEGDGILAGMFTNQKGDVWYARYFASGLYHFDIKSETLTSVSVPGFEESRFSNITIQNDALLLSSFTKGLVSYSLTTQEAFNIQHDPQKLDSILSNEVYDVLVGDSGILWCGTSKGLSYYSFLKQGSHINLDDSVLPAEAKIFQTAPLQDGDVLITSEEGVALFNHKSKTMSKSDVEGLTGVRIYSAWLSPDNSSYWFAHDGGISYHDVLNKETTSFGEDFNDQFQLPGQMFYTIWGLNENEALVSSQFGEPIFRFHKQKGVTAKYLADDDNLYTETKAFSYASVFSQGQLWLASTVGLINVNAASGEYQILFPSEAEQGTEFVDVDVDLNGTIWAASTDFGLFSAVPAADGTGYQLVAVSGLQDKQITNVVPDNDVLWLSTITEILKYDIETKSLTEFPNLLSDWEVRFIPNSMSIGGGHLTIGSSTGLISINTQVVSENTYQPNTIFTGLKSGNASLNHLINNSSVVLPYELNNLEFSFASLDYHGSDRLRYQYRLIGFDKRWFETIHNRVTFTNLLWGDYIFEVQGSNSDGVWSGEPIQFEFTIRPAWWLYVIIGLVVIVVCFLVVFIYSRHKRLKQLHEAAMRDSLTGIGNRAQFNETLEEYVALDKPFALILFDIHDLKNINDIKGYWFGDALIKAVADRLISCLSKTDECARIGGGEFAVLTRGSTKQQALKRYARNFLDTLIAGYKIEQETIICSFSMGINQYPHGGTTAVQLHRNCDLAFFKSKQQEPNSPVFFNRELEKDLRYLLGINQDLNSVIENQQLYVVYQPKWRLDTLQFNGAEALVRWEHPVHGHISPAVFIEQAEANGTIVNIGDWILDTVCQHIVEWRNQERKFGRVAVNISPIQVQQADFVHRTLSIIDKYDLPYSVFEFEITENVILGNRQGVVDVLTTLQQKGISIALDDFGTGYSSLSYLTRLPLNTLKIDKALIDDITTHPQQRALFASIARLAYELNLSVVVEGIETQAQLDIISTYPCSFGQGYLLSKPLSKEDFQSVLP